MTTSLPAGRLSAEVAFALKALRAASHVMDWLRDPATSTLHKEDRTPVTAADLAIQAVVAGLMAEFVPGETLVAEESSRVLREPGTAHLQADFLDAVHHVFPGFGLREAIEWLDRGSSQPAQRFWALDPIDGTKGLLRGGQFATALALIENGTIVLGALACPRYSPFGVGGSFALAVRGEGAWAAPSLEGAWSRLSIAEQRDPAQCRLLRSVESGKKTDERLAAVQRSLGTTAPEVRMDSQVKYLALACGAGDLIVRLPRKQGEIRENIWDHASGVLLVEEAGGRASDVRGESLDFAAARQMVRNLGVVASNGWLHEAALEALRRTVP